MPLPREFSDAIISDLDSVQAGIDALPATPTEADLPAIVAIVSDLKAVTAALTTLISKVRISQ